MSVEFPPTSRTAEIMGAARAAPEDPRVRALEATVRRRDAVLAAIAYAATRFLGPGEWDEDIRDVLGRIGAAAEVSRVYLFEGIRDDAARLHMKMRNEWAADGVELLARHPALCDIELASVNLARWESLGRGDVVHGPVEALLPGEQQHFARLGIRSIAAMPVFAGDRWWGYAGYSDDLTDREWSRSVLESLQTATATIGAAIHRRMSEEELRQSEERFRRLTEAAVEGVIIHDQGIMLEANPAFGRIFGYDFEELRGRNVLDLIPTPESKQIILEHMRSDSGATFEVEGRHKDGSVIIAEITARPTSFEGKPARVAAIHDITARKEAEKVARRLIEEQAARASAEAAERRAAFLAEGSRVLGSSFDYQTTLSTLTHLAVPAIADYCTVDLIGRDGSIARVGAAHVVAEKEPLLCAITKWVKAGAPVMPHLQRALLEGESTLMPVIEQATVDALAIDEEHGRMLRQITPRSLIAVPLQASGKVIGAMAMYMSESGREYGSDDLALAEELALRAALAVENARLFSEAEQATRARDQMLGVVAHDLRNPLSTILMASEMLDEAVEAGSLAKRQVSLVIRAGERMNRLIQDLLDVKRIEAGGISVERRPVAAASLISDAADMLRPLAAASGIELTVASGCDLPHVCADTHRMQQVLSNLVGNAIKFTPRGGRITLAGEVLAGSVRFAVSDTGAGIPADQLPHIFGQFWQGSRTDRRGIGLGLSIAKAIVEAHEGRIWVESAVEQGSTFYFSLPIVDARRTD